MLEGIVEIIGTICFVIGALCFAATFILYALMRAGLLLAFLRPAGRLQAGADLGYGAFIRPLTWTTPQTAFDQALLVQVPRNGRMVWQPIPTVDITQNAPLDGAWISAKIEAPQFIKQGRTLVPRVEVSNNHKSKTLTDACVLEIQHPSSAVQVLGPEPVELDPQGDTTSIYFQWTTPYVSGNYLLRFLLLDHQVKTEKVLVVE